MGLNCKKLNDQPECKGAYVFINGRPGDHDMTVWITDKKPIKYTRGGLNGFVGYSAADGAAIKTLCKVPRGTYIMDFPAEPGLLFKIDVD